jgi:hypothetical protein
VNWSVTNKENTGTAAAAGDGVVILVADGDGGGSGRGSSTKPADVPVESNKAKKRRQALATIQMTLDGGWWWAGCCCRCRCCCCCETTMWFFVVFRAIISVEIQPNQIVSRMKSEEKIEDRIINSISYFLDEIWCRLASHPLPRRVHRQRSETPKHNSS